MTDRVHGALPLTDDTPLRKYPLAATYPAAIPSVERVLPLTYRVRSYYDQRGPLCVSYSINQLLTFHNGFLYHPGWIYYKAGGDGEHGIQTNTALSFALQGNVTVPDGTPSPAPENDVRSTPGDPNHAIKEFRWLSRDGRTAVDEARTVIAAGLPFVFAFGWSANGSMLHRKVDGRYWMVFNGPVTQPLFNWHQICITGAMDSIDAFYSPNSYGLEEHGTFHFGYENFAALIDAGCYGATITDKVTGIEKPQPMDEPAPPVPIRFACPRCKKTFATKAKRKKHIKRRHR